MPTPFTKFDLTHLTDYLGFESLCNDLMSRLGFNSIQPLGGSRDQGRDAIHVDQSGEKSTVFAYSTRKDWKRKLLSDLKTVHESQHDFSKFAFVTTRVVSGAEFDTITNEVKNQYGYELAIYDLNRISTIIENDFPELISRHSNIFRISSKFPDFVPSNEFSPVAHAAYMLGSYERWVDQYTPLLAEHRELDTFVDLRDTDDSPVMIPVTDIPDMGDVSILLGESGAGKSLSLWKIAEGSSKKLREGDSKLAPVIISLRSWSSQSKCRHLFDEQLSLFDLPKTVINAELRKGSFLILFDGMNEVRIRDSSECRYDVARFIKRYPGNCFVISCRTSDYKPDLIPLKDVKAPTQVANLYEICRLDKVQITQYATAYFMRHAIAPEDFFQRIGIFDDATWEDKTSPIHLARIPLYLQLFLDVYRKTGQLPDSQALLLKALIGHIIDRENSRRDIGIDEFAYERILAQLSYRATEQEYSMQLPTIYAQAQIEQILISLRNATVISADVTFGDIWRGILSVNFLKSIDDISVAWLHQLIRDYFLGAEYARIWHTNDPALTQSLKKRLNSYVSDLACSIALGLLGENSGPSFLWQLIQSNEEIARRAYESQSIDTRTQIITVLIHRHLDGNDHDSKSFKAISRALPYLDVVESLDSSFYESADHRMRALLVEAIAEMIVEFAPKIADGSNVFPGTFNTALQETRLQSTTIAIRRGLELLRRYLKSDNELAAFYACKGMWEHDRAAAAEQLRRLYHSSDAAIANAVRDLMEEWGIT